MYVFRGFLFILFVANFILVVILMPAGYPGQVDANGKWIDVSRINTATNHYSHTRSLAICQMDLNRTTKNCSTAFYRKFQGKCYKRLSGVLWDEARSTCHSDPGGRLAVIASDIENQIAFQVCNQKPFPKCTNRLDDECNRFCFVGLWQPKGGSSRNNWEWESMPGVRTKYTNWMKLGSWEEPDQNEGVEEDAAALILSGWSEELAKLAERMVSLRIVALVASLWTGACFTLSTVSAINGMHSKDKRLIIFSIVGDTVCAISCFMLAGNLLLGLDPGDPFKREKITIGAFNSIIAPLVMGASVAGRYMYFTSRVDEPCNDTPRNVSDGMRTAYEPTVVVVGVPLYGFAGTPCRVPVQGHPEACAVSGNACEN